MTVQELDSIANRYCQFSIDNYLQNTITDICIFAFDPTTQDFSYLDGVQNEDIKNLAKKKLSNFGSGIAAGYGQIFEPESHPQKVDIFIFNQKILSPEFDPQFRELLAFHEIVHLLEKTKYYETLNIAFTETDERIGLAIDRIANKIADRTGGFQDFDHNVTFGKLLNHFIARLINNERAVLVNKAMSKNFLDDYTHEFI